MYIIFETVGVYAGLTFGPSAALLVSLHASWAASSPSRGGYTPEQVLSQMRNFSTKSTLEYSALASTSDLV
jgi:hypothetical protein